VFVGRAPVPVPAESFDPQSLCETRSDADRLTIRRRRPAGHSSWTGGERRDGGVGVVPRLPELHLVRLAVLRLFAWPP